MSELLDNPNIQQNYFRIATACPEVAVADVETNVERITTLYEEACDKNVAFVTFPEASITGYTLYDYVHQMSLLDQAETGLVALAGVTEGKNTAMAVGLPLRVGNALYNCAAILAEGEIKGIVPKQYLPNDGMFQEKRWYQPWTQEENISIDINGKAVPFGVNCLFDIGGDKTGIEICEDFWVTDPPSRKLAENGALVVLNLSASPELIGKAEERHNAISAHANRMYFAYAYASSGPDESTTDFVMGGHQLIYERKKLLAERKPLSLDDERLLVADVDVGYLRHERMVNTNFPNRFGMQVIGCTALRPLIEPNIDLPSDPFLPAHETPAQHAERLQAGFDIASMGLAQRLKKTGIEKVVLGLSGGLDSTLALLMACRAAEMLGRDPSDMIRTITMPGMASSSRTQNNAQKLAAELGLSNEMIPIEAIATQELYLLNHDTETQDVTYENVQARARTELLFNYANMNGCLVLGTSDLSEGSIGYCTFNGDHMSSYNPMSSVAKTEAGHMIRQAATLPLFKPARLTLGDIVVTPFSPELVANEDDTISQKTEDIVGPYRLHEFFRTYLVHHGQVPTKVRFMAEEAFGGEYSSDEIAHWFGVFARRFIFSQHKRSVSPDGAQIGAISNSSRGVLRLPSDVASTAIWQ